MHQDQDQGQIQNTLRPMAKEKTLQDFGGDQVAFAKYQEELKASSSGSPKPTEDLLPSVKKIIGILSVVSDNHIAFRSGSSGRFLVVNEEQILISEALFQSNKNYLVRGTQVTLECEERIADKTGYVDTNPASKTVGQYLKHKNSGLGFIKVLASNEENAIAKSAMSVKAEVSVTARLQMMAEIKKTIGDDSTALGVALSGAFNGL